MGHVDKRGLGTRCNFQPSICETARICQGTISKLSWPLAAGPSDPLDPRDGLVPRELPLVDGSSDVNGCMESIEPLDERPKLNTREEELIRLQTEPDDVAAPVKEGELC